MATWRRALPVSSIMPPARGISRGGTRRRVREVLEILNRAPAERQDAKAVAVMKERTALRDSCIAAVRETQQPLTPELFWRIGGPLAPELFKPSPFERRSKELMTQNVHVPLVRLWEKERPHEETWAGRQWMHDEGAEVVPLPAHLFKQPVSRGLVHRLVKSERAGLRRGTAHTKNRGEIRVTSRKHHQQKGSGRARAGDTSSPIFRGGAKVFGPRAKGEHGWDEKVNQKERHLAMAMGLSDRWAHDRVHVVDRLHVDSPQTRPLYEALQRRAWRNVCLVLGRERSAEDKAAFAKAARNIPGVLVLPDVDELGLLHILRHDHLVFDLSSLSDLVRLLDPQSMRLWVEYEKVQAAVHESLKEKSDSAESTEAATKSPNASATVSEMGPEEMPAPVKARLETIAVK